MTRPRYAFVDESGPVAFAHRGGGAERPENTWASFGHATDLGYTCMETDVHVTSDGVVVAIHDPFLDRVADRRGTVADLSWNEVSAARIGGSEVIPRLDELLAAWPETRWSIDAKHEAVVEPLVEVIRRADAVDRVCVASFSDGRIARVRAAAGPSLCTGTGSRGVAGLRVASLVPALAPVVGWWRGAAVAQVPLRWGVLPVLDRRYLDFAHRSGLAVHAWTIDDEATMDRLLDAGVDGIITDRPTLLREVLRRRGQWTGRRP